ncbi:MAG TPA: tetratricopeptide repeat protein [Thermoanaerobaculia bacterium]|nr:tetratricopeptide repeat protein [Thermoanaerobaculia bacterium]
MRTRTLLTITSIGSMAVGAVVLYLVLSVPNDLSAGSLMRTARQQIAAGDSVRARETLGRIVQQYPRTDAAAAAMVALASLSQREARRSRSEIDDLRRQVTAQRTAIENLTKRVDELANPPAPQPLAPPPSAPAPKSRHGGRRH